jgi:hypothetical protein
MAHQAPWRDAIIQRNAHRIRAAKDPLANDPNSTPDERAFRIARLRSPMMAQQHDQQVAFGHDDHIRQAVLTMREAIAASDEDVATFYPGS